MVHKLCYDWGNNAGGNRSMKVAVETITAAEAEASTAQKSKAVHIGIKAGTEVMQTSIWSYGNSKWR